MNRGRERGGTGTMVLLVALVVVAAGAIAVPLVLGGRQEADQAETEIVAVGTASDISAQGLLRNAIAGAQTFYAENGTYQGYGPQAAAAYDPSVPYNSAAASVVGHVSIRGVAPTSVVLATKSESGAVFCVGATLTGVVYGHVDALSAAACVGGW